MKKTLTAITAITVLLNMTASAQQKAASAGESFGKGTNVVSVGVGLGGQYTYWGGGYSQTPNLVASYENGTFGNVGPGTISLGALIAYKGISDNFTDGYNYNQRWNYWIIGLRSAYHWNFTNNAKCDPYAGLMLAYYDLSYNFSTNDPYYNSDPTLRSDYNSYMGLSMYIGFRYYVSNTVGLWAELGYGYSNLAIGVNFKF